MSPTAVDVAPYLKRRIAEDAFRIAQLEAQNAALEAKLAALQETEEPADDE